MIFPTSQLWLVMIFLAMARFVYVTPGAMQGGGLVLKVACSDASPVMTKSQTLPPMPPCVCEPQGPDQLPAANVEPVTAPADRWTSVLTGNWAEQTVEQLIPCGVLTTTPVPVPLSASRNHASS